MINDREMIEKQMQGFAQACERLGLKATHQRMAIFRVVISTEEHPDASTVYLRVKKRIPTISLDTVYRNLKLLAEHGLISIVGLSQESLRFDANMHPHHHFACVKCGMIRDFSSDAMDNLTMPAKVKAFGVRLSLHLEVKGICTACQRGIKRG